jgi:DNA replicative helicase MCM subunit Mcm2 (Cdc46/Mcm family)
MITLENLKDIVRDIKRQKKENKRFGNPLIIDESQIGYVKKVTFTCHNCKTELEMCVQQDPIICIKAKCCKCKAERPVVTLKVYDN